MAFAQHRFDQAIPHLARDVRWTILGYLVLEATMPSRAPAATPRAAWPGPRRTGSCRTVTQDDTVVVEVLGRYTGPDGVTAVASCHIRVRRTGDRLVTSLRHRGRSRVGRRTSRCRPARSLRPIRSSTGLGIGVRIGLVGELEIGAEDVPGLIARQAGLAHRLGRDPDDLVQQILGRRATSGLSGVLTTPMLAVIPAGAAAIAPRTRSTSGDASDVVNESAITYRLADARRPHRGGTVSRRSGTPA